LFKNDFHNVSIRAWRDPKHIWHKFLYLVSETDVLEIIGIWPIEWQQPMNVDAGSSHSGESFVAKMKTK